MITIARTGSLRGTLAVPGDKSISHRSIMLGAIALGQTRVRGFLKSADCLATIRCFEHMGIRIREEAGGSAYFPGMPDDEPMLVIDGRGLKGLHAPDVPYLDAGNSGTTVRLMSGILAGQSFPSRISGDRSLSKRPMARIIRPLRSMGIQVVSETGDAHLPLVIYGGEPHGIRYVSHIASAQVKSCVLLAALYADGPTVFREPALSRNHTELMLSAFGANLKVKKRADGASDTILYPGPILRGQNITVPGDISSAAFFLAAALITERSEVTLTGVGINETRDGILRVIRAMGGDVEISDVRIEGGEPVADLTARSSSLHGTEIGGAIIPSLIDELPVIAVMAACAKGRTVIRDASELKVKESNRLSAICENLSRMGIRVTETEDGMIIDGGQLTGASINPLGDHRLAMAFSVAGLAAKGKTVIEDEGCVDVSYPGFYDDLASLLPS